MLVPRPTPRFVASISARQVRNKLDQHIKVVA
jgi:hypothetical protein